MSDYVFWMTIIFGVELVAKLVVLGTGRIPERKLQAIALDAFFLTVFIGWGIYLLAK